MKKQTNFLFYLLSLYVLIQFSWWGYLLIFSSQEEAVNMEKRTLMILGEGSVFLLLLLLGFWRIKKSINKEIAFSKNQNNFLLSITHELKTPIAAIKLFLQTLQKGKISITKNKDLLEATIHENQRLENLINNILFASAMDSNKMKPHKQKINVATFLEKIKSRHVVNHPLCSIKTKVNPGFFLHVDEFMLETVLNNLLDNAIKYSVENCEITIVATSTKTGCQISISDNGPGIKKNEVPSIFNRFYRIENEETRSKKGSGLGLFISKQFILLHGGRIEYEKNMPTGSIFKISLPA
ncbi:MAG: HAMP domain-containing sensor histidine kinase [Crocinitomicaceae bacterium]|nr:HAMP domain-containing sensor histidine kinase [Crocinitomicaceae bacterium]